MSTQVLTTDKNRSILVTDENGNVIPLLPSAFSSVGINQLTGDVTAGPGAGAQAATVVGIQGFAVPVPPLVGTTFLTDTAGVLGWTTEVGITQLTGDVTAGPGNGSQAATVVAVNGATVPVAGALVVGQVLTVFGVSALAYVFADGIYTHLAAGGTVSPNTAANCIVFDTTGAAGTVNLPAFGTALIGEMHEVHGVGATTTGALTINAGAGNTIELYGAPGTFSAPGGSTTIPAGSSPGWQYALKYDLISTRWLARVQSPSGITQLTGDVTAGPGSSSQAATVAKVNGATVPGAGALTTGNVLQVTGVSSLGYAPLNLAGGVNFVTGILPAANQAAQTLAGDVTGTTAADQVVQLTGNAGSVSIVAGTSLTGAAGSGGLALGSMTGNTALPTGSLTWAGANTKAGSLVSTGAAITITADAASTWSTSTGALSVDAATALNLGATNATSVAIGKSGITTTVTGGLTQQTGAFSLTGNAASLLKTTAGNLTFDGFAALVGKNNGTTVLSLAQGSGDQILLGTPNTNQLIIGGLTGAPGMAVLNMAGDTAVPDLFIDGGNAFATATVNTTGGNIVVQSGLGATGNATFTSGHIRFIVNSPNAGGTEAYTEIARASTVMWRLGAQVTSVGNAAMYSVGVTPSASNYVLQCNGTSLNVNAPGAGQVSLLVAGAIKSLVTANGLQVGGAAQFGGGTLVFGISNAVSAPNANPTGGGVLYGVGGAGTWRSSGGTVTTFAPT